MQLCHAISGRSTCSSGPRSTYPSKKLLRWKSMFFIKKSLSLLFLVKSIYPLPLPVTGIINKQREIIETDLPSTPSSDPMKNPASIATWRCMISFRASQNHPAPGPLLYGYLFMWKTRDGCMTQLQSLSLCVVLCTSLWPHIWNNFTHCQLPHCWGSDWRDAFPIYGNIYRNRSHTIFLEYFSYTCHTCRVKIRLCCTLWTVNKS